MRLQISRRVERNGKHAVRVGFLQPRVPGVRSVRAKVGQSAEQPVERSAFRTQLYARERRILMTLTDLERGDRVIGTGFDYLVQDAWKDERVDDVTTDLDDFGRFHSAQSGGSSRWSIASCMLSKCLGSSSAMIFLASSTRA